MSINLIELKRQIANAKAVLVYFSASNCSVCQVLQPKITNSFIKEFPKIKQIAINSDSSKEITSNYGIFSFPTILVFFEGNEFFRVSRNLSIDAFIKNVQRPYKMLFKENE